jgi:hypothetical protein
VYEYGQCGHSVSSAGDVDGDGRDDLLIGAPWVAYGGNAHAGQVYLVSSANPSGALSGNIDLFGVGSTIAGATFGGTQFKGEAGFSVSSAGDFNGDGLDDFLIGAPARGIADNGKAYLIFGHTTWGELGGTIDLATVGGTSAANRN